LIGSTPEEVQRDISGILDWVYSDRFTAARRMVRDSTTVSESQMDIVLNQWSRSSRRIVFLLLVRTRLGQPRISAADIGKATGISVRTVYDVIHKLVDSEVIIRTEGRRTQLPDKTYSAECCSYVLPHKAG
jgi:CRP-like cAMP-binding protein